jgi:hypothetical protein
MSAATELLHAATALADNDEPRLAEIAGLLADRAGALGDLSTERAEVQSTGHHVRLAALPPGGPVLGLRWFPPGVPTLVHGHAGWGAVYVLDGVDRYERWEPAGDGQAHLAEVRELRVGDTAWFGRPPHDVHRQVGTGDDGAWELVIVGTDPREASHPTYTPTLAARLLDALATHDIASIPAFYAPAAVIDAHVPRWRYQLLGGDAIAVVIDEEYPSPVRLSAARTFGTGDWQAIEMEARFPVGREERLFHEIDLLRLVEGRIAEQVVYCTGIWDAATIRRHAAGAPMVRR